jgi:hypothetical protein
VSLDSSRAGSGRRPPTPRLPDSPSGPIAGEDAAQESDAVPEVEGREDERNPGHHPQPLIPAAARRHGKRKCREHVPGGFCRQQPPRERGTRRPDPEEAEIRKLNSSSWLRTSDS